MTVLSLLRGFRPTASLSNNVFCVSLRNVKSSAVLRGHGHEHVGPTSHSTKMFGPKMWIMASRHTWDVFKDEFHFYFMLGVIPLTIMVFLINIFIGPATLCEIPEGYEPKHWEYQKHPITRWYSRYFFQNPQEVYERNLHYIIEDNEIRQMMILQARAKTLMTNRADMAGLVFVPTIAGKYARRQAWDAKDTETKVGFHN